MSIRFSFFKKCEGGIGQREAIALLAAEGIEARPATSVYVGHTAVEVATRNKRVVRKVERILYGK